MKMTTSELQKRLEKILNLMRRPDTGMPLYLELSQKSLKYKEMIDFINDHDLDKYLREEEAELDKRLLEEHTNA